MRRRGTLWQRRVARIVRDNADSVYRNGYSPDAVYRVFTGLLEELAEARGMSWTDIAAAAGVSISALRKWRKGKPLTAASLLALARTAALLDVLENKGVAEPASWMEMPLPLPSGYSIRPIDLYAQGCGEGILDLAEPHDSGEIQVVLDRIAPAWREERSDYEVFTDTDGQRSMQTLSTKNKGE